MPQLSSILTPADARWPEFLDRLEGQEGCNFCENPPGEFSWLCDGSSERSLARNLLAKMDVNIDKTLEYFAQHGGSCDCEVVFNVQESVNGRATSPDAD